MTRMQSALPARKVWVGAAAGALVTIILWIIETAGKTTVPSGVAAAMTTLVTAIVSYLIPPSENDQVITQQEPAKAASH